MKENKDDIKRLLKVYRKTSAKRIAKEKRIEARLQAEQKARELFEKEAGEKMDGVIRTTMKKFMKQMKAEEFVTKNKSIKTSDGALIEQCFIDSAGEKETGFYVSVTTDLWMNKLRVAHGYTIHGETGYDHEKLYALKDVNESFIRKQLMKAMEKFCMYESE